jgi:hypothetical protein
VKLERQAWPQGCRALGLCSREEGGCRGLGQGVLWSGLCSKRPSGRWVDTGMWGESEIWVPLGTGPGLFF